MAARHLRHDVGRCRRNHDKVGLARQPDVADVVLVLAVEQVREHLAAGERADRKRRHEFPRALGHDGPHVDPALAEPPDQVERLVGGDAAGNDQQDFRLGRARAYASHGLIRSMPQSSKSPMFRVAIAIPLARAIAAIRASKASIGLPDMRRVANTSA